MAILEFKKNNFGYNKKHKFIDFNMEINKGEIVSLIGPANSGKTTLLKMICHKLPNDCLYYIDKPIKTFNIKQLKKEIVVAFDEKIINKTVKGELEKYLIMCNYSKMEITKRVEQFSNEFLLDANEITDNLSVYKKSLLKVLKYLILKPKFIALDGLFDLLEEDDKKRIVHFIRDNDITLLNVIYDLNNILYSDKVFVIDNFVLILEGTSFSVLKTDILLKRLGFTLPLALDLSIGLNNYDILNNVYFEKEKLVKKLWK